MLFPPQADQEEPTRACHAQGLCLVSSLGLDADRSVLEVTFAPLTTGMGMFDPLHWFFKSPVSTETAIGWGGEDRLLN